MLADDLRERGGIDIREAFTDGTFSSAKFFTIYGSTSNVGHGGSALFIADCQTNYILRCMQLRFVRSWRRIEIDREAHDAYNAAVQEELSHYVWMHPAMNSWYKNSQGKVTTNLPWRLVDYWQRLSEPEAGYFVGR